jgi:AcrR family transcriptional regulator
MPQPARLLHKTVPTRRARGLRTRTAILRRAVDIASAEGLEGLTLGRLAEDLGMSKSGLFAHFGSKEELQLATVEMARQIFIDQITRPALAAPRGMPRLWSILDRWLAYIEGHLFKGGCFFTAASFEFDSRRGPVRDRIAEIMREWIGALERAVRQAQEAGHIDTQIDVMRLAFEIQFIGIGGHWANQLLEDPLSYARARAAMLDKLRSVATRECPPLPSLRTAARRSRRAIPESHRNEMRPL